MRPSTYILYTLVAIFALCHIGLSTPIVKRQVLDNPKYIDPAEQDLETNEEQDRGKRKIEGAVELTYGAKNAVLGLLFNKINSFIDQKTAWVNNLDQTVNVAKNKQYNIEPPKDPISSFGDIFGSVLSSKLTAASPLISLLIQNIGSLSGGASGGEGGAGGGLGGLLGGILGGSGGGSSGGQSGETSTGAGASASVSAGFNLGR